MMVEPFVIPHLDGSKTVIMLGASAVSTNCAFQVNQYHPDGKSKQAGYFARLEDVLPHVPANLAIEFRDWLREFCFGPIADDLAGAIGAWARTGATGDPDEAQVAHDLIERALQTVLRAHHAGKALITMGEDEMVRQTW